MTWRWYIIWRDCDGEQRTYSAQAWPYEQMAWYNLEARFASSFVDIPGMTECAEIWGWGVQLWDEGVN
jgi:hypothetical protein